MGTAKKKRTNKQLILQQQQKQLGILAIVCGVLQLTKMIYSRVSGLSMSLLSLMISVGIALAFFWVSAYLLSRKFSPQADEKKTATMVIMIISIVLAVTSCLVLLQFMALSVEIVTRGFNIYDTYFVAETISHILLLISAVVQIITAVKAGKLHKQLKGKK